MPTNYLPDTKDMMELQQKADDVVNLHGRSAPRYLEGDTYMQYRRRLAENVQKCTSADMQKINLHEAMGSAFEVLEKQIYDDAIREARHPTNIPKGEMREVRKLDDSGRPIIEFKGSPSAWMNDFSTGANNRRVAGIRTETQKGYIGNMSNNLR